MKVPNLHNLKYKTEYEFYNSYQWEKCSYYCYRQRFISWVPLEKAIKKESIKRRFLVNEIWRACTKCLEFKEWDKFAIDKWWINWHTPQCLICRWKTREKWRQSYIWKIKTKNLRIIRRSDPNYRKYESERYKERREKNKESLYKRQSEWHQKNKIRLAELRKKRELSRFLKWEKVIYNWNICQVMKDWEKWNRWVLIDVKWIRILVAKDKLKPFKQDDKKLNLM